MKKTIIVLLIAIMTVTAGIATFFYVFKLPINAQLSVLQDNVQGESLECFKNEQAMPVDDEGILKVLVWNIYKQSREGWRDSLLQYSHDSQLALLQEVSMTPEFKDYINTANWFSSHVDAFQSFDIATGVLNLSLESPLLACAYLEAEPWLQLPKSGIYAVYRLSDGRKLVVINLHSVNFTYGTAEYRQQLAALMADLKQHQGPVIFAGDLNSWSAERINIIRRLLRQVGLTEVKFSPDHRKKFLTGLALDHVFYRGLTLQDAGAPVSDASDHNPLIVRFSL
jgi:endonuclease/exonuclease/phosphatase (EEP) superfamily protein YafD